MTREEIMELDLEGIEARKAEMRTEVEQAADSAALDALEAEKAIIEERVAQIRADIETRKADMAEVMNGKGGVNLSQTRATKEKAVRNARRELYLGILSGH